MAKNGRHAFRELVVIELPLQANNLFDEDAAQFTNSGHGALRSSDIVRPLAIGLTVRSKFFFKSWFGTVIVWRCVNRLGLCL